MKRLILAVCLVLATTAAFSADVPKDVVARYREVERSLAAKDLKAFHALFADDFVNVDPAGKTTKREPFLAGLDGLVKSAKTFVVSEEFKKVTKSGDTVAVSFVLTGKIVHLDGTKATVTEVGVDTWKKIKGTYQMIKTVDTKFEVKDDKPAGKMKK